MSDDDVLAITEHVIQLEGQMIGLRYLFARLLAEHAGKQEYPEEYITASLSVLQAMFEACDTNDSKGMLLADGLRELAEELEVVALQQLSEQDAT